MTLEAALAEIARLEKLVYVPGVWRCPKCKLVLVSNTLYIQSGTIGANNEPQQCANGCGPMWRKTEREAGNELIDQMEALVDKARKYDALNTPELENFLVAVEREALHQRARWNDTTKTAADWFWLVGYLAGKALHAAIAGDRDKFRHHIITTAAACFNWHAQVKP